MFESKQKVFDDVVKHLNQQKCQCTNKKGSCMYRGPNNLKCAFGIFIPDEIYNSSMEGEAASNLLRRYSFDGKPAGHFCQEFNLICNSLQSVHDHHSYDEWPQALKDTGKSHGLSTDLVDQLDWASK